MKNSTEIRGQFCEQNKEAKIMPKVCNNNSPHWKRSKNRFPRSACFLENKKKFLVVHNVKQK